MIIGISNGFGKPRHRFCSDFHLGLAQHQGVSKSSTSLPCADDESQCNRFRQHFYGITDEGGRGLIFRKKLDKAASMQTLEINGSRTTIVWDHIPWRPINSNTTRWRQTVGTQRRHTSWTVSGFATVAHLAHSELVNASSSLSKFRHGQCALRDPPLGALVVERDLAPLHVEPSVALGLPLRCCSPRPRPRQSHGASLPLLQPLPSRQHQAHRPGAPRIQLMLLSDTLRNHISNTNNQHVQTYNTRKETRRQLAPTMSTVPRHHNNWYSPYIETPPRDESSCAVPQRSEAVPPAIFLTEQTLTLH